MASSKSSQGSPAAVFWGVCAIFAGAASAGLLVTQFYVEQFPNDPPIDPTKLSTLIWVALGAAFVALVFSKLALWKRQ